MYICPVCGFEKLEEAPANYVICPCCGTEFEYDDFQRTHSDLRQRWLASGAHWFSTIEPAPPGWDYRRQLSNLLFVQPPAITFAESHAEVTGPIRFRVPAFA